MRIEYIDKFVQEEETLTWLVDGLLPATGWTLIYGEPGIGKTTFVAQMCAALQTGKEFIGRQTTQTNIVYVQADSSPMEWREMLRRIAPQSKGMTIVDVPSQCFENPAYVEYIAHTVRVTKPGFIVFDSLYNLVDVQKINTGASQAIAQMKQIAGSGIIPWLLVHHPPQGELRAAGGKALSANCSNEWCLMQSKLAIRKGRLVKDKEIKLKQSEDYLWHAYETQSQGDNSVYFRRKV